jgi:hypothetical protein
MEVEEVGKMVAHVICLPQEVVVGAAGLPE